MEFIRTALHKNFKHKLNYIFSRLLDLPKPITISTKNDMTCENLVLKSDAFNWKGDRVATNHKSFQIFV